MKHDQTSEIDTGRRSFLKKTAYAAPAIVTLSTLPSFASAGSGRPSVKGNEGVGNGYDPAPPGHNGTNYNDFEGTAPGNPGHTHPG